MTPISEIPIEMVAMAAGCTRGNPSRIMALLLVSFEERTEREAEAQTGIERTMIRRDRKRFQQACKSFRDWRCSMKIA